MILRSCHRLVIKAINCIVLSYLHPTNSGYSSPNFRHNHLISSQWARMINRKRFFGTKLPKYRRYGNTILYTKGILRVYKGQLLWNMVVLSLSISYKIGIFLAHFKKKHYLCTRYNIR